MGAKGVRGDHLVQMCRVCVRQPRHSHVETWSRAREERKSGLLVVQHQGSRSRVRDQRSEGGGAYTSRDETAFIGDVFRCGPAHNSIQGQAGCTKRRERGRSFRTRSVRVWATFTSGCARGAKGDDDPVHPAGIKVTTVSRSGVRDHTHDSVRRRSQRSKSSIQTRSVRGGCGCIPSSDAEVAGHPQGEKLSYCHVSKGFRVSHASPCETTEMGRPLSPIIRPSIAKLRPNPAGSSTSLHKSTSLVPSICRTSDTNILNARMYMLRTESLLLPQEKTNPAVALARKASDSGLGLGDRRPVWNVLQNCVEAYVKEEGRT